VSCNRSLVNRDDAADRSVPFCPISSSGRQRADNIGPAWRRAGPASRKAECHVDADAFLAERGGRLDAVTRRAFDDTFCGSWPAPAFPNHRADSIWTTSALMSPSRCRKSSESARRSHPFFGNQGGVVSRRQMPSGAFFNRPDWLCLKELHRSTSPAPTTLFSSAPMP